MSLACAFDVGRGETKNLCCSKDRIYLTDLKRDRLRVFDLKGTPTGSVGSRGKEQGQFNLPFGICAFEERIYICDRGNHRIQILSLDLSPLRVISTGKSRPVFVGCLPDSRIVFSTDDNEIHLEDKIIYRTKGMIIGGLCTNSLGQIIVADSKKCKIYTLSTSGKIVHSFPKECSLYEKFVPGDVCVDKDDNVLVADYVGGRICIFGPRGTLIREMSGLLEPLVFVRMRRKLCC